MIRELIVGFCFFIASTIVAAYSDPLNKSRALITQSFANKKLSRVEKEQRIGWIVAKDVHLALGIYCEGLLVAIAGLFATLIGILGEATRIVIETRITHPDLSDRIFSWTTLILGFIAMGAGFYLFATSSKRLMRIIGYSMPVRFEIMRQRALEENGQVSAESTTDSTPDTPSAPPISTDPTPG